MWPGGGRLEEGKGLGRMGRGVGLCRVRWSGRLTFEDVGCAAPGAIGGSRLDAGGGGAELGISCCGWGEVGCVGLWDLWLRLGGWEGEG